METHTDGQCVQRRGFKLTKIGRICQPRGIFFGGDDDFLFAAEVFKAFEDGVYIVFRIGVMVCKAHHLKSFVLFV